MNRRELLQSAALMASATALDVASLSGANPDRSVTASSDLLKLKSPYDQLVAASSYRAAASEAGAPPRLPNTLLHYDENANTFKSPLDLKTEKEKGGYTITATLRSFNIARSLYNTANASKPDIQIGLNFTAPLTSSGDKFAWIAKNAVNIFLQTAGNVPKYLSSFKASNPNSNAPTPTNKIEVLQGKFDMQVNAFFQKKDGFWRKLFQTLGNVPGSPLLATLGIPGIALEALDFVTYSINKLTQDEQLQPIWDANPLTFGLTNDVTERFKFTHGLWVAVDSTTAKDTKRLSGYTVDLVGETFQIQDSQGNPLDATYLVADFDVEG